MFRNESLNIAQLKNKIMELFLIEFGEIGCKYVAAFSLKDAIVKFETVLPMHSITNIKLIAEDILVNDTAE